MTPDEFLTQQFDREQRAAEAAEECDPAPWSASVDDADGPPWQPPGHGNGHVWSADGKTGLWDCEGSDMLHMTSATAQYVAHWHPARVLAEIAAKRRMLAMWVKIKDSPHYSTSTVPHQLIDALLAPYGKASLGPGRWELVDLKGRMKCASVDLTAVEE